MFFIVITMFTAKQYLKRQLRKTVAFRTVAFDLIKN